LWTCRFGQKPDLKSGVLVDFDQIYNEAIKPAIEGCGLEALRGDQERTGGIISQRDVRAAPAIVVTDRATQYFRSRIRRVVRKLKENLHRN
jgi:hypothetical protein